MIKHSSRQQNNNEREGNTRTESEKKSEIFYVLWQINAQSPRTTTALWVAPKTIKGGPNPRDKLHGNSAINGRRRWGNRECEEERERGGEGQLEIAEERVEQTSLT